MSSTDWTVWRYPLGPWRIIGDRWVRLYEFKNGMWGRRGWLRWGPKP